MAAFFICYGLQSIRCETTDFTILNNLILKALFSVPRFIFGHFEGSDDIFHQKNCISELNQMLNSHFGSTFRLGIWKSEKMAKKLPYGHDFIFLKTKLVRILTNYVKISPIKSNQSNLHRYVLKILLVCYRGQYFLSTL